MSPCCSGSGGARNDSAHSKAKEQASNDKAADGCCTGTECGCDDNCIDQLARAICANDDDHLHISDGAQNSDKGSLASEETCKCEDDDKSALPELLSYTHQPSTDASESQAQVHSCGLRKRKTTKAAKGMPSEACGEHKSLARKRQQATLSAFGCVCKALLARGLQSCCSSHAPVASTVSASLVSLRKSLRSKASLSSCCGDSACGRSPSRAPSRRSVDSCCAGGCCDKGSTVDIRTVARKSRASLDSCAGDCCKAASAPSARRSRASVDSCCAGGCCSDAKGQVPSLRKSRASLDSCAGSCCGKDEAGGDVDVDVEKRSLAAAASPNANRCVLAVKGMTCTGCENKLIRTLKAQPAISNVKTSLVLCRAEFDYACDPEDLPALIQTIEKRTGFTAERIAETSAARALELATPMPGKMLQMSAPAGVIEVVKVKKDVVRVVYDPHAIGAREVMASYEICSPTLAPEPKDPALTAGAKHIRMLLLRLVVSAVLTIPVLVMAWAPLPAHPTAYAISSLVLATLVQIGIAGPFYSNAFKSLFFSGLIETDLLVVLSTTTAYIYSLVAFAYEMVGRPLQGGSFFETSTLLVTLIMFGQLASALARQRAVAAISLRSLQQSTALLVTTDAAGHVTDTELDARLLQYGDTVRVLPDSGVITDGLVLAGASAVDEALLTGEAAPVEKTPGARVLAGTRNGPGALLVRVTRLPGADTLSALADMVDAARFSRARVQGLVDRVCAWFVPAVLALAGLTLVVWVLVGVYVRRESRGAAVVRAVTYAIAVLAISCPCAIGLAVPMVVLVASGVAARLGLVFKAAATIERAREVTHAVFDKTGTLTTGQLAVAQAEIMQEAVAGVSTASTILALVSVSKHPVARAVAAHLGANGDTASPLVLDVEEVTSKGIQGTLAGTLLQGGNAAWLGLEAHPAVQPLLAAGLTVFCAVHNGALLVVFALADTIRPEAPALLALLAQRGIAVSILSGDHAAAVARVAGALGVPAERARAGCDPAGKAAYLAALQARGARVLFCGDGTNDSVALAQADVGVHMAADGGAGAGAAAADAADAVLVRPSLDGVGALLGLSDAVRRRILLNFAWAAVYNTVAILFAAGAFVNARIAPAYAGLGEIVSVLPVVLIAMQLKWYAA
ncbi:heavy metal translocating P-type ATPase [Phanerochaete sordida]|uniref:Heavy metal translocating P-type ATPase n=1 Tax=Phanerochaete sordida TaxID=48140 RepID=A0A9P3LGL7_9APHY|nr:heavy metal translocating P-type ATPase [Phanerochaete sordida]